MLRVGLTGSAASGKSTVGEHLAAAGFPVLDADRVVHELYRGNAALRRSVLEAFPQAKAPEGGIDRRALEGIVHPAVMEYISRWFADRAEEPAAVVEAALWPRLPARDSLDVLIVVAAGEAVRRERLRRRGLSETEVRARLNASGPMPARETPSRWVIRNEGSLEALAAASRAVAERLRQRAQEEPERD